MAAPRLRNIARWTLHHFLWDARVTSQPGLRECLWATRKLAIAVILAALLTWVEWVKHHPPEIALVALLHFVFVLVVLALIVRIAEWLRGTGNSRRAGPTDPTAP